MNRMIGVCLLVLLASGSAAAQPPATCQEEVERLRYLVQHFQAGRTGAEFEVARLQVLIRAMHREIERLKSAPSGQIPEGVK